MVWGNEHVKTVPSFLLSLIFFFIAASADSRDTQSSLGSDGSQQETVYVEIIIDFSAFLCVSLDSPKLMAAPNCDYVLV